MKGACVGNYYKSFLLEYELAFPYGFGPLLAHTLIPCTLWQLKSNDGVKGLPLRLQASKPGGKSTLGFLENKIKGEIHEDFLK